MTAQVIGSSDVDAGKLPAVLGDRVHLQQVPLNLILNGGMRLAGRAGSIGL
jgi:nitrogen-specific signal transduction histidine kinase